MRYLIFMLTVLLIFTLGFLPRTAQPTEHEGPAPVLTAATPEWLSTTIDLEGGLVWLPSFDRISPLAELNLLCIYDCTAKAGLAGTVFIDAKETEPNSLLGVSGNISLDKLLSLIPEIEIQLPFEANLGATALADLSNIKHFRLYWGATVKFVLLQY